METEVKVFHSEISRVDCEKESHLYDLLKIEPAKPATQRIPCAKDETWEFKPNYEKRYSPKRVQSKLKVKTVSDVRTLFEKDVYMYLASDLELQQNYLLRKIRDGSSSEEKTKETTIRLLNANKPISRTSWQMLSNINPERHNHSKQFVLWNGTCIQVNGSKGGKNKFISNHDLKNKVKKSLKNMSKFKKSALKSRAMLLRNSLNVKFKPGPLRKKKFLDVSHQKYQMGDIELVQLPPPVLEVSPTYGTVLEPTISSYINNLRGEKGMISKKFAEFATSVLGTTHNNTAAQLDENCCITFDLNYKCNQSRLLMRRNVIETTSFTKNENDSNCNTKLKTKSIPNSPDVESNTYPGVNSRTLNEFCKMRINEDSIVEINQIMNEMLESVDISVNQDSLYSKEDEPRDIKADDGKDFIASKDKSKRKYCELDKLDVTIINLPESSKKDYTKQCGKSFCTLGCVCESLDFIFSLKQHCGVFDCMFGCKCEVSKYKNIELLEQNCSDIIPGLLNLDNEINAHLAKEEQKFHQTVIFSGDKSIVLKSRKRDWKSSKRYAEFYSKMNLKGDEKIKRLLTVDIERLNCANIEPLCMVHNLYKCFCRGKFTETYMRNDTAINTNKSLSNENTKVQHEMDINKSLDNESTKIDLDSSARNALRPRLRKTYGNHRKDDLRKYSSNTDEDDELSVACARTMGYHGRKYHNDYYVRTNRKIKEMEENDTLLKTKMLRLVNGKNILSTSEASNKSFESLDCEIDENENEEENHYDNYNKNVNKTANENIQNNNDSYNKTTKQQYKTREDTSIGNKTADRKGESNYPFTNTERSKGSLRNWLETSYKSYKERLGKGMLKNCLEAPKKGKAALQSWDFILSRYRERKNIFVVSKQEPYRLFLAVDDKHPLLANCLNIDNIRFADLPRYPIVIQNLVTNATDSENVFCILRGWDHCWELIGSAVKVIEQSTGSSSEDMDFFDTGNLMTNDYSSDNGNDLLIEQSCELVPLEEPKECNEIDQDISSEKSKWFVLTVENDFTEIQFYKKGFYVTYEGIQRSINLARISGKTVRLSSRARTDKTQNTHPYGIYAIPCTIKCCVFIGPYEVDEPLGIEVVKSVLDSRRLKKTRGVWINTNKLDNKNVIDNPLAYLPSASIQSETIPIANIDNAAGPQLTEENDKQEQNLNKTTQEKKKQILKQIKPIKIRRTNGFYHLLPKNFLKNLAMPAKDTNKKSVLKETVLKTVKKSKETNTYRPKLILQPVMEIAPLTMEITSQNNVVAEPMPSTSSEAYIRPVAEIAPQIKITHVYSERKLQNDLSIPEKIKASSMLVLKPEEINKKIVDKPAESDEVATDIEKFLETCTICIAPQEVLLISDGEDDAPTSCKDVWIQCCNVENFGYIRAKINEDGISFEFPGFKYSEFYKANEAFDKINQVLARKMYIPKHVKLQWKVIVKKQDLTSEMLTPKCLEDKKYLLVKLREKREKINSKKNELSTALKETEAPTPLCETPKSNVAVKTYANKKAAPQNPSALGDGAPKTKNEQMRIIQDLEEASRKLEKQSAVLWKEAVTRRDEIFGSLSVPDDFKDEMTEALQDIMSQNE